MKKRELVSSGFELSTICRLIKGTNNDCSDYIKGKDKVEDAELTKGWWQIVTPLLLETAGGKQNVKGTRQIVIKKAHVPFFCLYWGTICTPLRLKALDGKMRKTNCANTEGIFRIIQSIPSPKAEPFKRWLAKVEYERVQEIENPVIKVSGLDI